LKTPGKNTGAPKIDIHYVAAHARVSIATVSRTLNHVQTVDPLLAQRVWKSVTELNYLPNTQARALVSGKSKLLGLIVSEITNPFFPELIQEFERAAVERGYEILIASTSHDPAKMETCVRRMLERRVDGVAVMTFGFEEMVLDRFSADNVPCIFIDVPSKQPRSSVLSVDYRQGIYEGVQHLAVLGHRKIGFISGPLELRSSQARKVAFLGCMRSVGLTADSPWLIEGDHTLEGGRDAMLKLLALKDWPTAIMCSNDMTAIGVQHALFEAKLKVPEDFSLIGFDNIHLAEYTIPPLTTVRMSCADLAQKAVRSLLSHLQPDTAKPETEAIIETHLVVRQTTGLPRDSMSDLAPVETKKKRPRLSVL
jgi:LacI family transcriptional regulator